MIMVALTLVQVPVQVPAQADAQAAALVVALVVALHHPINPIKNVLT